jgi:hypothetical protein
MATDPYGLTCPAAAPLCPISGIRGCTHRHRRWYRRLLRR